ncbi:SERPIN domain-containing protein [Heracleum sosnowskyi]|uniref:SERPIN domain-containing protein n=1 Tax=Heracleum sosnowskyi TaxID=360622 RepID=A0AAD8M852_9APIA|nr:SERPIN domain-containing protein [Heracleum sosnowskyi]
MAPNAYIRKGSQHLRKKQVDVSLTLAKHLLLNNGKDSNLVFSPISIQVVLSLLAAGSSGETLEQLLTFLKAKSIDDLNTVYAHLVDVVFADGSSSGGPIVSVANGVWLDEALTFKNSYQHVAETTYKAASHRVDFKNKAEEVRNLVNLWAEKETHDLVKEILPAGSVDRSTKLILANALYFKGVWSRPFNASHTKHFAFHLLDDDSSSIQVPFMTSREMQYISVFEGFKVLKLSYKQGLAPPYEQGLKLPHKRGHPKNDQDEKHSFSMFIILPDAKDGLPALIEKAESKPGFLDRHYPREKVKVGEFRIPKFKFEYAIEASEALKSLGLVFPFDQDVGLREMVSDPMPLFVSKIFHKSLIEVDEQGTEAAAATSASLGLGCGRPRPVETVDFVADHPFLFIIRENTTGIVQFMGHVLNPSKT